MLVFMLVLEYEGPITTSAPVPPNAVVTHSIAIWTLVAVLEPSLYHSYTIGVSGNKSSQKPSLLSLISLIAWIAPPRL